MKRGMARDTKSTGQLAKTQEQFDPKCGTHAKLPSNVQFDRSVPKQVPY